MKTITNNIRVKTLIFAETIEQEAYNQIKTLANFEAYQNEKIRIMPDVHAGKGCTIGTTMTITDKLTPNLVGVDIGCGMLTVKLKNEKIDFKTIDEIIKTEIPSGFKVHKRSKQEFDFSNLRCKKHVDIQRASLSIGSLGGGNHFIEISKSEEDGSIYLIIHSGSRKLGSDTCKYYQNKAIMKASGINEEKNELIERLRSENREKDIKKELRKLQRSIPNRELAFLTGQDFDDYINDMAIVQKFASVNRETMANIILKEANLQEVERFETIHNYIDFKRMILRKGAVSAEKGEKLLIPINMRDGSLLCIGKGNADWNYSAPHGAGRLMSRTKAKQLINIKEFKKSMADVYSSCIGNTTLDEAPQAYKSITEIKNAITDTADVIDVLKPLYNFKAH